MSCKSSLSETPGVELCGGCAAVQPEAVSSGDAGDHDVVAHENSLQLGRMNVELLTPSAGSQPRRVIG